MSEVSHELGGYFLSDDPLRPTKWQFPVDVTVPGGGFLVVFASGNDHGTFDAELHTNFRLSSSSGSVFLFDSDGETVDAIVDYPEQRADISYGRGENDDELTYFVEPSPGQAANDSGVSGLVADTKFDVDRGFFEEPFAVTITSATPDAFIYFTTDGSIPSASQGTRFETPIPVETTTILRAIAVAEGKASSNVDTQTYLFLSDVLRQNGEGLPGPPRPSTSDWDYEMDPDIVNDPRFESLDDDLKALRSLSIAMPVDDLWGRNGIYANPTRFGEAWERECSIEILDPEDSEANHQQDAGLRMQGAGSRFRNVGKKSMRLAFRTKYGAGKLRYPLFGDAHPDAFDTIVLRGSYFDSWTVHTAGSGAGIGWNNALQFRTDFGHQTHLDMGAHEILRDWVHLYLNGQYWGIYNIHERPDEEFAELHLGGSADGYDVLKQRPRGRPNGSLPELTNGDLDAWRELMALVRRDTADPAVYAEIQNRIELDPFIDYILMNLWGGNQDWPHNNWYAIRHRPSNGPFQFYNWDPENYIFDVNVNQVNVNTDNSPGIIFSRLRRNDEFRLLFADHVQRHCFNGGALTPEAAARRFQKFVDRLQAPMNAESARWGDERVRTPLNTIDTWLPVVDDKLTRYFPRRTGRVLSHLRSAGLYPRVVAPELIPHGGDLVAPFEVTLEAPVGTIHFTLDGTDPRQPPGFPADALIDEGAAAVALVPSVGNGGNLHGGAWNAVAFDPVGWMAGATGVGFEAASGYEDLLALDVSEMHNGTNSVFIRVPFEIPDQAAIEALPGLFLSMKYDDGFVSYLNGVEVAEKNAPGDRTWQSAATASHSDSQAKEFEEFDVSEHRGVLVPGQNVLAIHGLNQEGSNDLLISPRLSGGSSSATGGVSGSAMEYKSGFTISQTTTVKARVLDGDSWSALTEATFRVGTESATSDNLLVSEIHYHPAAPDPSEVAAGFDDPDLFEFIEITNVGASLIDLSGVRFALGVRHTFPDGTLLEAGGRMVLVKDANAFSKRYAGVAITAEFDGNLANNGERILLVDRADNTLADFSYDDSEPWPGSADGDGFALQATDESAGVDLGQATNWMPSTTIHGTPGAEPNPGRFTGNPDDDNDGDGQSALAEYAFGTSDDKSNEQGRLMVDHADSGAAVVLSFVSNRDAVGIRFVVELSTDLALWETEPAEELVTEPLKDGRELRRYQVNLPGQDPHFVRLRVISAP